MRHLNIGVTIYMTLCLTVAIELVGEHQQIRTRTVLLL